jgi:cytochrome c oxidase cbb3-type subunit 4
MTMDAVMTFLRSFWVVWVMVFFLSVLGWTYWPKNKEKVESWADIPLRDDGSEPKK